MFSGRTLALLAVISFVISMIVWQMSEERNTRMRGEMLDKIIAECSSNVKFLQTGRHDPATKDVTDDVLQEMSTGGRQELNTRWLMMLSAPGVIKVKDTRLIELKKLATMIETYNAEMSYQANADAYGSDDDYGGQRAAAPAKQQIIDEFNKWIKALNEAKEHKNNLDF